MILDDFYNYYAADPDYFTIDGFKQEVNLMDEEANTIRTILIENVDNLLNLAINYEIPYKLGN